MKKLAFGVAISLMLGVLACSSEDEKKPDWKFTSGDVNEPEGLAVSPDRLPPATSTETITLPGGGQIHMLIIDGKTYVPIEATFSEQSWQTIVAKAAYDGLDKG